MLWIDASNRQVTRQSDPERLVRAGRRKNPMNASRLPYLLSALVTCWFGATAVYAIDPASPIGLWKGGDATFEMFESEGKLSARIVGLSVPKTAEGKEKTDIYNPDPKQRSCPIIGLVFISGFTKKSDTLWENGTVYDPKSGKTYSCFMELEGPDKIKVRGFLVMPLMGRNYFWTRTD
jgi:uncharacterized protein (DUF2147 family)